MPLIPRRSDITQSIGYNINKMGIGVRLLAMGALVEDLTFAVSGIRGGLGDQSTSDTIRDVKSCHDNL